MTTTSTKELILLMKESQLSKSKAEYILENFKGYFELAKEWEKKAQNLVVTHDDQIAEMKMAREGRLFLAKKRIAIEHARKELKAEALREGQTIDSIARVLKNLIVPIEEHLEKQEKFLEIKEKLRKQRLREERIKEVQRFEDLIPFEHYTDFENWENDLWDSYIIGLKTQYKQKQKEIEAEEARKKTEIEAEKKRIQALELHQKRSYQLGLLGLFSDKHLGLITESDFLILKKELKAEAEKLREEAEKKEETERKKRDQELVKMRQRAEAEQQKKEAEIRKLKAEAEARKKAEEEARKKAEAEAKKKAEAPDIEKAKNFLHELENMKLPDFQSDKYLRLGMFIKNKIHDIAEYIYSHTEFKNLLGENDENQEL